MNTNLVKRLLFFITLVLTAVVLISCKKQTDKPEEPIIEEPIEQEPEETPEEQEPEETPEEQEPETPEEQEPEVEDTQDSINLNGMFDKSFELFEVEFNTRDYGEIIIDGLYTTSSSNKYLTIDSLYLDGEKYTFSDDVKTSGNNFEGSKVFDIFKATNAKVEFDKFTGANIFKLRVNKEDEKQKSGVLNLNVKEFNNVKIVFKSNDTGSKISGTVSIVK